MKYGYRVTQSGVYVPQYEYKNGKWNDILLKHIGSENTALHQLVAKIGKEMRWAGTQYYFQPGTGDKREDMALFFQNEILVCAFLGAAKFLWSTGTRVVEL